MSADRDVAIVGMACLFPKASNLKGFWHLARVGLDAVDDVPPSHWSPDDYFDADPKSPDMTYCRRGGFLSPISFDPTEFSLPPAALEATDTSQLLGLVVAKAALEDAGYGSGREFNRQSTSVILGVTGTLELVIPLGARLGHPIWRRALLESGVDPETTEEVVRRIADDYVPWQENSFPGLLGNVVAGRIANRLDLQGTNCVVDAACASSLSAVHLGVLELGAGRADMVVTGGVDTFNDIFMFMCFSKTPALSASGQIRPFDESADGTMLGEGLGMIVLKRLADARRDGDRIYAVIRGVGTASDGVGQAVYAPSSPGQARCLRDAYRTSGVDPGTVELVEAHGTGTKVGDAVEFEALREVYSEARSDRNWCALGSVKSNLGHTKAAAGAAGMIKAALALYTKVLPATLKVEKPNPRMNIQDSPFYLNTRTRPWPGNHEHPRRAALSSFGFGGSNYHVVLEEADPLRTEVAWDGSVQIFAFSAATREELIASFEGCDGSARSAGLSRQSFSPTARWRAVLVGGDTARAARLLQQGESCPDLFVGQGATPGELAFLFPGQGSQQVDMGCELACLFPQLLESLEAAGKDIWQTIYPPPAFTASERDAQKAALTRTEVAQPALGAVESGLAAILESFQVRPSMAAGHSYGELVALHAAGSLDRHALLAMSRLRGQLMAGEPGEDRGTMLAVSASAEAITRVIDEQQVVLANLNSPDQTVLSGSREAIVLAAEAVKKAGLSAVPLNVAAAFHSPLVARARDPFHAALSEMPWQSPAFPVYANATARPYPAEANQARALLADQLISPVRWVELMEQLYQAGARVFLEVGPRRVLSGLAQGVLGDRPHHCLALDGGLLELARVLAQLAALGYPVRLDNWEVVPPEERKKRMEVQLVGSNYRAPRAQTNVSPALRQAPTPAPAPVTPTVTPPQTATRPQVSHASPQAGAVGADPLVLEALRGVQSSLTAMQALQQQTASLHQRFLEGQELAQRTFMEMLQGQQRLVETMLGGSPASLPVMPSLPAQSLPLPSQAAPSLPSMSLPAPSAPPAVVHPPAVQPVPASPQTVAPAAPAAPSQPSAEPVLLAVVADKTGYPVEMLHLDMDLEADLGIDSIKRVEILAAVEERLPGMGRIAPDRVGSLRTLREVLAQTDSAAPIAPAPSAAAPSSSDAAEVLLAIVADKTGYPREMLHLEMDLESDLGIDSIKRVEILASLEEARPGLGRVAPDQVGSLRTLGQILAQLAPDAAPAPPASPSSDLSESLLAAVSEKTGYPREMLHLQMDLEADLGIDSIKRVEILAALEERNPGSGRVPADRVGSLRTLQEVLEAIAPQARAGSPTASPEADVPALPLERKLVKAISGHSPGPAFQPQRVIVLDPEGQLGPALVRELEGRGISAALTGEGDTLLLVASGASRWDSLNSLREGFLALKSRAGQLKAVASVTLMDGQFGLSGGDYDASAAGLAGLTRTIAHEWPQVKARALDVDRCWESTQAARAVVDELLTGGPLEVALGPGGRFELGVEDCPVSAEQPMPLQAGEVLVITGGARGVTAAVAVALARAVRPTLALLGRSSEPFDEPDWLRGIEGEGELKRAIASHKNGNGALRPAELEEAFRRYQANREVSASLERMRAAGSKVAYYSVDVRDRACLEKVIAKVRAEHGPIRGLIHGAGVLADKKIEDKQPSQFDNVFDTKVVGLRHLLDLTSDDPLKVLLLFSSVTARYGRPGQVDYCMANEVLNKIAHQEARRRPACRVAALGWGPWHGGMVHDGLAREFTRLGVGLINLEQGAQALVEELTASREEVEILLGSGLPAPAPQAPRAESVLQLKLSVGDYPFLASHVLGGRPVLPLAMMMEWFGHAALHANPGLRFAGLEEVAVFKGVAIENGALPVAVAAGQAIARGEDLIVPVELVDPHTSRVHARSRVVLSPELPQAPTWQPLTSLRSFPAEPEQIYSKLLFHGPHFHAIHHLEGIAAEGLAAELASAAKPAEWMTRPMRSEWLTDPLALDGVLQLGILWCREELGKPSLPSRMRAYRQFQARFPRQGVRAELVVNRSHNSLLEADVRLSDEHGHPLALFEGLEWTADAALDRSFEARSVVGAS
ncbi:SDR family NAD(P)-dependent oxidoreductase [bacterium CPR1]|nr:SDR family NAD(P)-dependent oxidoreductase [bacterium CPR1]